MSNACGVLGKTDFAEDSNQVCNGEWDGALAVSCKNSVYVLVLIFMFTNMLICSRLS